MCSTRSWLREEEQAVKLQRSREQSTVRKKKTAGEGGWNVMDRSPSVNFELSGGAPQGGLRFVSLSVVLFPLFIVCFCYVSLFNVLYAVL